MLIYRDDERLVEGPVAWRALAARVGGLPARPSHDEVTGLLIESGEIEAAVLDGLFPGEDDEHPLAPALRRVTFAAGLLFLASWRQRNGIGQSVQDLREAVRDVSPDALPRTIGRRTSEGYAFYALHPETYAAAADRYAARSTPRACCIGIRSIGTSLSAVVAAALQGHGITTSTCSVRPRGHPYDRTLRLGGPLRAAVATQAAGTSFLIVDEGPGLSGSSFASVARALRDAGVEADRIAFFPSWDADGSSFRSASASRIWREHSRWTIPASALRIPDRADRRMADWSGGAWRAMLVPAAGDWPAVHPQHERIKRLLPDSRVLQRFAGLGQYGVARLRRAERLAGEGFGEAPRELTGGYLALPFVPGRPCRRDGVDEGLLEYAARYAACLTRAFPSPRAPALDTLHAMIETNFGEADAALAIPALSSFDRSIHDTAATVLDGRMLIHEFVRTAKGVLKTDTLDHASDHFFPGCQDIAWDLAALEAELDLDGPAAGQLLALFAVHSRDRTIRRRMPFYRIAYAAFQLGYSSMAAESLGDTPDGQRFARRRAEFLARGRALLAL